MWGQGAGGRCHHAAEGTQSWCAPAADVVEESVETSLLPGASEVGGEGLRLPADFLWAVGYS